MIEIRVSREINQMQGLLLHLLRVKVRVGVAAQPFWITTFD
jgi:hypothetical protein